MNPLLITLVLFNILLVLVIVVVFIRMNHLIRDQGFQIQVLLKHNKEAFKESMSPAQRYAKARKYLGEPNGLLPSDKQVLEKHAYETESMNQRGDYPMPFLLGDTAGKSRITDADMQKSGANAIKDSTVDTGPAIPDTSLLPAERQTGVIDTEKADPANFSTNPRVDPSFLETSTTFAPNESSQESFRWKMSNPIGQKWWTKLNKKNNGQAQ